MDADAFWRNRRDNPSQGPERASHGAIGAFCGILVIGVAEYTWYYPRNMFTYWFLFGVIGACIKLVRMEQDKQAA